MDNKDVCHELPAGLYVLPGEKRWSTRAVSAHSGSFT